MSDLFSRILIVLCRPEGGGNVGSVCRSMKNNGLSRLALVSPSPDLNMDQLKAMAVHAEEIYENALVSEDLGKVLESCVFSGGITRRRGHRRKFFSYLPEDWLNKCTTIAEGDIALVFGNEQNGLNDGELSCCMSAVHIPSSPDHPSYNLAQAVQIMTYSLFRQSDSTIQKFKPITEQELSRIAETIYQSLKSAGVIKLPDTFNNFKFFHDIMGRATLSKREQKHLEKLFQALKHKK